jgi:hypothetical protein
MGDFLLCAQIEYFRLIDTEFDIAGPHVRMMWQKILLLRWTGGYMSDQLKILKNIKKLKKFASSPPLNPPGHHRRRSFMLPASPTVR